MVELPNPARLRLPLRSHKVATKHGSAGLPRSRCLRGRELQQNRRIQVSALPTYGKVQVWRRRASRSSAQSNKLASFHFLSFLHFDLREVQI